MLLPLLLLGGVAAYFVLSKPSTSTTSSTPITSVPLGFDNAGNPSNAVGAHVGAPIVYVRYR